MLVKVIKRLHRHLVVYGFMPLFNNFGTRFYLSYRPSMVSRLSRNEMKRVTRLWEKDRRGNNRGDWSRLYALISNIDYLNRRKIPGAVAELGVYKGTTAKILNMLMPERNIYLFDTFNGFDKKDLVTDASGMKEGHYKGTLDEVQAFIGQPDNIYYCKGVFPVTVSMVPDNESFALVHLDCDLYEPTKAACIFFYERLQPGGLMIFHDYHSTGMHGVWQAVNEFFINKPEVPVLIPDKSGTAIMVKNNPV